MSVLAVRVQLSLIYPCQEHKEHRMYVPELASSSSCLPLTTLPFWPLLLSHPLTMRVYSSLLSWKGIWPFVDKWQLRRYREKGPNYSRSLVRKHRFGPWEVTGGRNGYGAKLTNIFIQKVQRLVKLGQKTLHDAAVPCAPPLRFEVECGDSERKKKYYQIWEAHQWSNKCSRYAEFPDLLWHTFHHLQGNMQTKQKPKITSHSGESFTKCVPQQMEKAEVNCAGIFLVLEPILLIFHVSGSHSGRT